MNLLLLNTADSGGGAAIATYRLHQGLRSIGVDAQLLVRQKRMDDSTVVTETPPKSRLKFRVANYYTQRDEKVSRDSCANGNSLFSPARCPDQLAQRIAAMNPDLVHLFWINFGFLRIESLKFFKRPIIWTLHDMWPFTGGCHYDAECGKFRQSCGSCPLLGSATENDLSRSVWGRKQKSWRDAQIVVVATSHWLAEMAQASSLFRNRRVEVIPNCIDIGKYKPLDKHAAREAYGLPTDKHLILISAFNVATDKRKGNHFLITALKELEQEGWRGKVELVVIGAPTPDKPPDFGLKTHYMGTFNDEISQVLLYSAADVTVAPSMQENLSNTVMESLACGTPVVAFNIGGMPDLITHQKSGYLARPFEPEDLAAGMKWVLEDNVRREHLSHHARESVVSKYSMQAVAHKYHALYQDILQ